MNYPTRSCAVRAQKDEIVLMTNFGPYCISFLNNYAMKNQRGRTKNKSFLLRSDISYIYYNVSKSTVQILSTLFFIFFLLFKIIIDYNTRFDNYNTMIIYLF